MPPLHAVITIGIDPNIDIGPVTLTWHGLTIVFGIVVGTLVARRWTREADLDREPLLGLTSALVVAAIVGARVFYIMEHGGPLLGTRGFTFDGGVILAAIVVLAYVVRAHLSVRYLDAIAAGLPLGVAIGRIGDVINGEHYGSRSDFFLAVRNSHPDALTPDSALAFQNGGLYEVLLALLIFGVVWPLRHRVRHAGGLAWLVLGSFAVGRFFEFFLRSDSPQLALGLNNAQWTSLLMLAAVATGWLATAHDRHAATSSSYAP